MPRLDNFDRTGVSVVALCGGLLGLMVFWASDIRLVPALSITFPGLIPGVAAARLFGLSGGIVVCGLVNGAIYGTLWYAWLRMVNAVSSRIPGWSKRVAGWLVGLRR
jgi:hypothetical protein